MSKSHVYPITIAIGLSVVGQNCESFSLLIEALRRIKSIQVHGINSSMYLKLIYRMYKIVTRFKLSFYTIEMCDKEFRTQRIDPRYPFQNQTKACYDNYCDFYKCTRLLGEVDDCQIFKRYFQTICPNFWIEHWDELREKGAFPGPI